VHYRNGPHKAACGCLDMAGAVGSRDVLRESAESIVQGCLSTG